MPTIDISKNPADFVESCYITLDAMKQVFKDNPGLDRLSGYEPDGLCRRTKSVLKSGDFVILMSMLNDLEQRLNELLTCRQILELDTGRVDLFREEVLQLIEPYTLITRIKSKWEMIFEMVGGPEKAQEIVITHQIDMKRPALT